MLISKIKAFSDLAGATLQALCTRFLPILNHSPHLNFRCYRHIGADAIKLGPSSDHKSIHYYSKTLEREKFP